MSALSKETTIGVVGAGTMGAGIAQIAANYGHPVKLLDQNQDIITNALDKIKHGLQRLVSKGKMTDSDVNGLIGHITPCSDISELADCGLVIEAIVENLEVKQGLFKALENICATETILATNTSSISVTAIGSVLERPQNLVGMHFFNPAPIMKLVEVISGLATAQSVKQVTADTATAWGKKTVFAKTTPGFIVNRVARPYYAESLRLVEEGAADVTTLDTLLKEAASFRMGPFELMDLIGHDVNYAVTESVFNAYFQDKRFLPSLVQKELVDAGFLGRKTGRGFYDYSSDASTPSATTVSSDVTVQSIELLGETHIIKDLVALAKAQGISVNSANTELTQQTEIFTCGSATLALTDGRTATRRADEENINNLIVFDLQKDFASNERIALAAAKQASTEAMQAAIGFFNQLGKKVSVLADAPGLCVMRTICMLANEGADAVYQGVCDVAAVDDAMLFALNYPAGPMAWADKLGVDYVCMVLKNLEQCYGLDRYRTSILLQQHQSAGVPLYE